MFLKGQITNTRENLQGVALWEAKYEVSSKVHSVIEEHIADGIELKHWTRRQSEGAPQITTAPNLCIDMWWLIPEFNNV